MSGGPTSEGLPLFAVAQGPVLSVPPPPLPSSPAPPPRPDRRFLLALAELLSKRFPKEAQPELWSRLEALGPSSAQAAEALLRGDAVSARPDSEPLPDEGDRTDLASETLEYLQGSWPNEDRLRLRSLLRACAAGCGPEIVRLAAKAGRPKAGALI